MLFRQIFDERLAQYAYLVGCQRTREAIVVDPERDVDRYLAAAASENLRLVAATETHIHADFLSGVRELAHRVPGLKIYLSDEGDADWKYRWPDADGLPWQRLRDGDVIRIGSAELTVVASPGHTPEHVAFLVTDRGAGADEPISMLTGDFVFVGDLGRPDLLETAAGVAGAMEPSARRLYASASALARFPDWLQLWPGHGAGSACGKALGAVPSTTLGYERRTSPALAAVVRGERSFVDFILDGQPEPPLYFARMKQLNKSGPPRLGELPRPPRLTVAELAALAGSGATVVLDTRLDRPAFIRRHLAGSIFAPLDKSFPTIAGSYVDDGAEIVVLVGESQLDAALRALVRIGLDRVTGWAPPPTLDDLPAAALAALPTLDCDALAERASRGDIGPLDVRNRSEYESGHFEGALHVPHTRLPVRRGDLPAESPLGVYCTAGARSASAASWLARHGFRPEFVDGDVVSWLAGRAAS